ncbi:hypothetical protein evm_012207 [Chilo suppressalis]|nr:hypothetical protein evm_012207 [Chilo suppressalis]
MWSNELIVIGCLSSNSGTNNTIYYNIHDKILIHFVLKETPEYTERYKVQKQCETKNHISLKDGSIHSSKRFTIKNELLNYDNNTSLCIAFLNKKNEEICVCQLPFHLRLSEPKDLSYNFRIRGANQKCLTREGCDHDIKVQCKNNGDRVKEKKSSPSTESPTTNYDKAYEDADEQREEESEIKILYNTQLLKYKSKTLQEGTTATFKCVYEGHRDNITLRWSHMSVNRSVITNIWQEGHSLSIKIQVDSFDNNTTLHCHYYQKQMDNFIHLGDNQVDIMVLQNNNVQQHGYKYERSITEDIDLTAALNKTIPMDCTSNTLNVQKWLEIRKGELVNISAPVHTFTMLQEHNDTWFVCIGLGDAKDGVFTRSVVKVIHITPNITKSDQYRGSDEINLGEQETEPNKSSSSNWLYYIIPAFGVFIAVSLIALVSLRQKRKNQTATQPHEVETYATARVQYVDLDIISSSSRRNLVRQEDTPYAEIIGFLEPKNK